MPDWQEDHSLEPNPESRRSGDLWHHGDFLKLWSGQTVSLLGDQFTGLAIPLTAVLVLHSSASQMGVLQALPNVPFLLLGLLAGAWADRHRKRRLMIISDVARALLLISIPAAFIAGWLNVYLLYAVSFAAGVFTVIFDITYQAYLPSLVERDRLTDANGKMQASAAAASVVGPGLAGSLIQVVAAPIAILVDSFSFVWSAASLGWIRKKEEPPPRQSRRPIVEEIREGLAIVARDRRLRSIAACTASANLSGGITAAVMILYAVSVLGMSPFLIGVMFALGSVGSLIAALVASKLATFLTVGRLIVSSAALFSFGWLLIVFARPPDGAYFLILAFFLASFGGVVYNVNQVSYRQALVPLRLQGRLNATMRFIVTGILPVGSLIGGALGEAFGLYPAIVIGALVGLAAFFWVFFSPVRQVKTIPTNPEEVLGAGSEP